MTSPTPSEERDMAGNLDLVDRLSVKAAMINLGEKIAWGSETGLMHEAAAEITRLRAEVDGMREALKPFADEAAEWDDGHEYGEDQFIGMESELTVGDLRRARAARGTAE